tara:strand:+ start:20845 stop:21036 length:192 start_codon:yes stop_codon:yes gene_type:complete
MSSLTWIYPQLEIAVKKQLGWKTGDGRQKYYQLIGLKNLMLLTGRKADKDKIKFMNHINFQIL